MSELRDHLLKLNDLPIEAVEVPEWGRTVYVRTITSADRDQFEESCTEKRGRTTKTNLRNLRARLVVLAVCKGPTDETQVFRADDALWLGQKSSKAIDRLYEVAARLAGLRPSDVEELVGNSETGQSAGSGLS